MIKGHGGNVKGLAETLSCPMKDIMDMSSNLNPLGPPEMVNTILKENLQDIYSLPDVDAGGMTAAFCQYHGIDRGRVVAGNGTTWFIYTLPLALKPENVVVVGPTYSDYTDACNMYGILCDHYVTDPDSRFCMDVDAFSRQLAHADMAFICNPNNPTGVLIPKESLTGLIRQFPKTIFVVDESYLPFVKNAGDISLVSETRFSNLVVLSSMSKIFTIPGLRTGFLTAHEPVVNRIMTYYQPWSVNSLAQRVIQTLFEHRHVIEPFREKSHRFMAEERQAFMAGLEDENNIELFDSTTSFVLGRLKNMTSKKFCTAVGQHKILIRDCANFHGLNQHFVRFSLKNSALNRQLVSVIRQVLTHADR